MGEPSSVLTKEQLERAIFLMTHKGHVLYYEDQEDGTEAYECVECDR